MALYDRPRVGRPDWRKFLVVLAFAIAGVLAALVERWLAS
jgi:hypothetical protein